MEYFVTLAAVVVGAILPALANKIIEGPKTKRRIQLEIIENIYMFFNLLKAHFEYLNTKNIVYQHLKYLRDRVGTHTKEEVDMMGFEMEYQKGQLFLLEECSTRTFHDLTKIESTLCKLNVEVSENYSKKVSNKINNIILPLLQESNTALFITDFSKMSYTEILSVEADTMKKIKEHSHDYVKRSFEVVLRINTVLK
jgi:hypothetical protein